MKERETNRFWKKILDTMNDGLMLVGLDGTILEVNSAFTRLTGYDPGEVEGSPCTVLRCDACDICLEDKGDVWCNLFKKGRDVRKRCIITRKDGSYLSALKNASLLKDDDGRILGAVETLTDISETDRLDSQVDHLSRHFDEPGWFYGIVGKSAIMQKVFQVVEKASHSDAPAIIFGESGTGKELVAQAIHRAGERRENPFVQLNCSALNDALLESELFGHVKGAFTGAYRHRLGRFEAAHTGVIFLDEIADIPMSTQVKLLRVLETKQFERVGDLQSISVDVRIITATNKDLRELIDQKMFREDLFFRINVIPILLPPLRERTEDIPLLINTFISRLQARTGKKITGVSPEAMEWFMTYEWPGNVRELKSAMEYGFVIVESGLIHMAHLPPHIIEDKGERTNAEVFIDRREVHEKTALIDALKKASGNQSQAARILGISRVTVWNRMRKYGINLKRVMTP